MSCEIMTTPNYGSINMDAGGRQRISQFTTLHDGKLLGYLNPHVWDVKGTGTGLFSNNKYNMSVTAGQHLVFQTQRRFNYFSGKCQAVELTVDNFAPKTGLVKRKGYFSSVATGAYDTSLDGFWLESGNGTITLKVSRNGTETLSKDITTTKGYAYAAEYKNVATWDNFTVSFVDFLWLGGAVMRWWLKTSKGFVLLHVFNYSGTAQDVFMLSPNQPVRYEIRSTTGTGSMRYVCSQVATEGSIDESGYIGSVKSLTTAGIPSQTMSAIGTTYALVGIRKNVTYRDIAVKVTGINMLMSSVDQLRYDVILNPTLSAPLTYSSIPNTAVQEGVAGAVQAISITASGGHVLNSGNLVEKQMIAQGKFDKDYLSFLGSTLDDVMNEIVLCVTPMSTNITINGVIDYKQY